MEMILAQSQLVIRLRGVVTAHIVYSGESLFYLLPEMRGVSSGTTLLILLWSIRYTL
jgi:hypothetical protein